MKVRLYNHVGQRSGYGRAAMDLCMALLRAGVDLEIRPLAPASAVDLPEAYLPLATCLRTEQTLTRNPDTILIHTLAGDCGRVLDVIGYGRNGHEKHPPLVAYTTWDGGPAPPEVTDGLGWFDQVWVPSGATLLRFEHGVPGRPPGLPWGKTKIIPHGFDEETLPARRALWTDKRPDRFRFYYVGAHSSRKNIAGLVRAYVHAFGPGDAVELVLRAPLSAGELARILAETGVRDGDRPMVSVLSDWRDEAAMLRLHRQLDVFVTASHGEAWNLPAFDAVLAGRHVIAPYGQGSDHFLDGTSADRCATRPGIAYVDVAREDIVIDGTKRRFDGVGLAAEEMTSKVLWQDPDLLDLGQIMRMAFRDKNRDLRINYDVAREFGYTAIGTKATHLLTELCNGR